MNEPTNQTEGISEDSTRYTRRAALGTIGKAAAASVIGLAVMSKTAQAQALNLDFAVESYRVFTYSAPQYNYESRIFLYNYAVGANCYLYFMKDGQTIPTNTVAANGLSANVYFPRNRFADIRDFLRYEKPVRITVVASNGIATLSNDHNELIGDHDI